MGEEYHIARKSVKVPVAELEWSLASGRESLSGLPHHRKPARNGFAEVERIIHHLPWEYHSQQAITQKPYIASTDAPGSIGPTSLFLCMRKRSLACNVAGPIVNDADLETIPQRAEIALQRP
jgi:hypothetical protein